MDTKTDITNMKFCQSCGMPTTSGVEYGTEEDGSKSIDYCFGGTMIFQKSIPF